MSVLSVIQSTAGVAVDQLRLAAPFLVVMLAAEVVRPARPLHWPTVAFNLLYAPLYLFLAALVAHPVVQWLAPWASAASLQWWRGTPQGLELVLLVIGYLMLFDLGYYWFHRAQHRWPFLWRFHQFHHADVNVAVLCATRHHWIEEAMRYGVITVPLLLVFGSPERIPLWLYITIGVHGLFLHWNLPLRLGPLTRVIGGPQYHRIHHSIAPEHLDKNFAVLFPFWDAVFGTQALPRPGEFAQTGIVGLAQPNAVGLLAPLPRLR